MVPRSSPTCSVETLLPARRTPCHSSISSRRGAADDRFVCLAAAEPNVPAAQPAPQPAPPREKPTIKEIRIVVAPLVSLQEQCKANKFANVDILIDADPTKMSRTHCPTKPAPSWKT